MSAFVLFFGGWRATPADMQAWKGSAKAQRKDVDFDAIPWPSGAAPGASSAVSTFKEKKTGGYKSVIDDIHAMQYANAQSSNVRKIYIVGHSSGCAIANAVDEGLTDHTDVVLVALDGFAPNPTQLARPDAQVWVARASWFNFLSISTTCIPQKGKQVDDICISKNYTDMKNHPPLKKYGGSRLKVHYAASNCTNPWALHFSLVNCAANDTTVKFTQKMTAEQIVAQGYTPCIANLVWLRP